jgi:hypothetical protein
MKIAEPVPAADASDVPMLFLAVIFAETWLPDVR